jgi:hypothetical protein
MKCHIKVWTTDLKECETFVMHGPESPERRPKGLPPAFLVPFLAKLEEQFPNNTFKVVPIGKYRYNVIPQPFHSA